MAEFKELDDDVVIEKIEDPDEKFFAKSERDGSVFSYHDPNDDSYEKKKIPVRVIVLRDVKDLAQKVSLMRKGNTYAKQFQSMSAKELEHFSLHDESLKLSDYDQKYEVDPKYGINWCEKRQILAYLEREATVKEIIDKIPKKKLSEMKKRFEKTRNVPIVTPTKKYIIEDTFGKEAEKFGADLYDINLVDIAEAFDTREKELKKPAKIGLFEKIKNLFSRKKALPAQSQEQDNSTVNTQNNDWENSLKIKTQPQLQANKTKQQTRSTSQQHEEDFKGL